MTRKTSRQQVDEATAGLPGAVRHIIAEESARAAGHNDNSRACYEDLCEHDADVARAMVKAYRLGRGDA